MDPLLLIVVLVIAVALIGAALRRIDLLTAVVICGVALLFYVLLAPGGIAVR